jgi:hypothetical protein
MLFFPFSPADASTNQFPHVTLLSDPAGPYAALYSNVLWERLDALLQWDIQYDEHGTSFSCLLI